MTFLKCTKEPESEMNCDLGHDSALQGYSGPGTTWANEVNFVFNHVPGSIPRPVDQQFSALSLCYGYPLASQYKYEI